jgi:DNA-binding PadR family transcriptional regulator
MRLFHKLHALHEAQQDGGPRGARRFARGLHHDHEGHERGLHRFGRGGRLARLLEHGDLKMLVLHLINEKPRHGYEIIKAIEDLAGGAYAPSPGVVYPTLTLLEELGQVESTAEGSRKSFSITPAGLEVLAQNKAAVDVILTRIAAFQPREQALPVIRAMENLKTALRLKLTCKATTPEAARKIADALDTATRQIEEI